MRDNNMKKENELTRLKRILEEYFVNDNSNEWVDVEISRTNRVDIKVVSDKVNPIKMAEDNIINAIDRINLEIENERNKFFLGFLNLHTIDEAEFFGIDKPVRRNKDKSSFGNLIDFKNNYEDDCIEIEERINKSRIITFYSYKGGVGRTIALIQTAYLLAKKGKKVLLMDLDIEAPSFYNIFRDVIKMEDGLVDYLYEELYDGKKIQLSEIISKLNLNLKGEIYIVSTGITDLKYVQKLEALKEKRIYENKYIQKLIRDAEINYGINYTLIDARTGINKWGALSVVDIADELMLFAYPNKENISGLGLILDIIGECKKTTIVLSRIDQSSAGGELAKKLFGELNIEQEYIGIYYEAGIALAQKYPAEEYTKPYEEISEFLLEEEINTKTNKYINDNRENVKKLLNNISEINSNRIVLEREEKISEKSNWIVIKSREDDVDFESILNNNISFDEDMELIEAYSKSNLNLENIDKEVYEYLNSHENFNIKIILISYIIRIANDIVHFNKELTNELEFSLDSNYSDYVKFFNINDNLAKIDRYKFFDINDKDRIKPKSVNVIIHFEKIISLLDYNKKYSPKEIIDDLLIVIRALNGITGICIKLILNNNYYEEYKDIVDLHGANKLNLSWEILDKTNVINDIDEILQKTINLIEENILIDIYESLIEGNIKQNKLEINKRDLFLEKMLSSGIYSFENRKSFCNMIYGKRVNPDVYSKTLNEWLYTELKKCNKLNKESFIKLIKEVSNLEENCIKTKENISNKSFINFSNFEIAMKWLNTNNSLK